MYFYLHFSLFSERFIKVILPMNAANKRGAKTRKCDKLNLYHTETIFDSIFVFPYNLHDLSERKQMKSISNPYNFKTCGLCVNTKELS